MLLTVRHMLSAILLALIVVGAASAQSQPPPPSVKEAGHPPQSKTKGSQQDTAPDQHGTEQPPPIVQVGSPSKSDQKSEHVTEQHDSHPMPDWWLIGVTFLLVVATGGLVYYARDTARRQLRAYVYVDSILVGTPLKDANVTVRIKNYGQTPAYNFSCEAVISYQTPAEPFIQHKLPHLFREKADIPPNTVFIGRPFMENSFSDETIATIDADKSAFYLSGVIRYYTFFNKERRTEFRYRYRPKRTPDQAEWEATPEGNQST